MEKTATQPYSILTILTLGHADEKAVTLDFSCVRCCATRPQTADLSSGHPLQEVREDQVPGHWRQGIHLD